MMVEAIYGEVKAVGEVGATWRKLQGQADKHGVRWSLPARRVAGG